MFTARKQGHNHCQSAADAVGLLMTEQMYHLKETAHLQKKRKKVVLACRATCNRLFWCELPTVSDIGQRGFCFLSNVMERDDIWLVGFEATHKLNGDVPFQKLPRNAKKSKDIVSRFITEIFSFYSCLIVGCHKHEPHLNSNHLTLKQSRLIRLHVNGTIYICLTVLNPPVMLRVKLTRFKV